MKTSQTTKGLSDALAKAQAVIQNPSKDAVNPHFKNRYATLDGGLVVIREALSSVGISFAQATRMEGDIMMLDTRLTHGDEWFESEYPVCRFPAKQQEIGSALTYAKRYSLFSICGIAGEDDDDANSASTATPAPANKPTSVKAIIETMEHFTNSAADVDTWWRDNKAELSKLRKQDMDEVIAACSAKKNSFNNQEAA